MKFTGEFFIPHSTADDNTDNPELEIEHKQRYLSILKIVEGKTVLDIACGEGYGTSILSTKAKQIFGVDINPDLVEHAGQKYQDSNIRFLHGSVDQIPLAPGSVDIIVSFETLEHVSAATQQQFLTEVRRVLRPGGLFIVSTPNRKNYTDRYDHRNKFHVHELYKDDFEKFLQTQFGYVTLYEQGLEVTSLILQEEQYLSQQPVPLIRVNNKYHFEGKYLIALCSDLPDTIRTPIASIVPESDRSYFQLIDRILQLQQEVQELGAWGTKSNGELDTSNARIRQLQEEHETSGIRIRQLQQEAEDIHASIEKLARELDAPSPEQPGTTDHLEIIRQNILFYKDITANLQEDLARSNHQHFLKEAELEVIRNSSTQQQSYSLDLEKFTEEVTRLADTISGKSVQAAAPDTPAARQPAKPQPAPAEDPSIANLRQQLTQLQDQLRWYKSTYEDRSLLGVIRQKIATKFRK